MTGKGHKLSITWDGGGDSGWCEFLVDDESYSDEYSERLLEHMYATLDYGSWAGEFQASGEAVYSLEEKAFVGEDNYTEDSTISWKVDAEIRIPKYIWFDQFHFSIDGYDSPEADFDFFIKNGFRSPDHDKILEDLNSKMNEVIDDAIEGFSMTYEFRSLYENESIPRSEFVEDGDDIVYKVEHLEMGTTDGSDREIYLDVKEIDNNLIEE
jgi:hypothetical protein